MTCFTEGIFTQKNGKCIERKDLYLFQDMVLNAGRNRINIDTINTFEIGTLWDVWTVEEYVSSTIRLMRNQDSMRILNSNFWIKLFMLLRVDYSAEMANQHITMLPSVPSETLKINNCSQTMNQVTQISASIFTIKKSIKIYSISQHTLTYTEPRKSFD